MKTKTMVVAALAAAILAGCSSTTGSTAAHDAAASPTTATSTAVGTRSPCFAIGGTVGPDQTCHAHSDTATYTLDFLFPVDYPDQQALTEFVTQRRDDFVDWVAEGPPRSFPYELNIVGHAYRSGRAGRTHQSLVLDIGSDTGVHPVTTYKAFNYDLSKHAPISFDTLFQPGTEPLGVS